MAIERADNTISICEIKFATEDYELKKDESRKIENQVESLTAALKRQRAVQTVLITPVGLKANLYSGTIQHVVTADRLFAPESYC